MRILIIAAGGALLALPVLWGDAYYLNMLILIFLLAIMASSWNIMGGYTGYISLGQSAFLGVGAYTTAIAANTWSISPFLAAPLGGLAAGALAAVLGLVTFRARGNAFIMITFAMLYLLGIVALNWTSVTNGNDGMILPAPTWSRDYALWPFYYALLGLLILTLVMSKAIASSRFGLGLTAIREDEEKAAGIGVNTSAAKLAAFVASSVPIGVAGGFYGYYLSFLDSRAMFSIVTSIMIVLAALLGGSGTLWGPVLGAFLLEPFSQLTNQLFTGPTAGAWRLVVFGGLLLAILLFLPKGIIPGVRQALARKRPAIVGKRLAPAAVPSWLAVGDGGRLEVHGIRKRFGGLTVLDGLDLTVEPGSITGLIGPNGSGKTTLFNLIDGAMKPDSGTILLDGRRIDASSRWARSRAGLGRTHQITRLFPRLSVLRNVVAGSNGSWAAPAITGVQAARGAELLDLVGLGDYRDLPAGELSYGQQKLIELIQILLLQPRLVLLDEPAGGINPTQIEQMGALIRELNRTGTTFLIVEHNMPFVLGLCDTVHVLAGGRRIASGTPQEVRSDPLVLDAYLTGASQ
ncbi:branched-chain amino acid ABC transporter ATP-binding protein/permease [Streptosporangium sp. NBC_01755]|uniref:branched-chain amino acid ABC transporter ATP-binding protein/permease n=1 Tax=unclassified Streptosporangium TaxID=2632669 RepID=UPI002DDB5330|nr:MULTISPECIES: branched-chain amino acid ABC transporter ATP-binding protein/permease [unclassified Streptosporangium]WSA26027.1 branched-chain amino acid ABC transporter ATP-binding protein/permease [Streptosporangium sp. NBC_01810]WSD02551.1 branched-chain amino acid ABC transporter ATP-binding protein/permease [Streptosporangium sp. NBC_01755]